ncbi:MAG: DNA-directed RNA polymerase subunit beta [Candidatus Buchananbacteria bacterium RIFCSPHIGHO2_01_FULL_39_14]|uniref:DNA-directed RNA polymerase subunit beta n=2 Tax=Candidatus Buchananiibacteriota TaxID=1817903 RepID=A0A1G1YU46_9BACT|nr:MAG: DNA-directed RNA polymerase subunit beta [Candidatus Buchananbacteria bacterium RIFCSPHIGHO2_01_FULL_39_14]OGY49155.1 MAG: DNA-directed RNA polymerase subunit beta [Candidatus Buchananbacteria bacterium RIFCSPHIGHO2_02_FULL_39_17]OGY55888.1 MAG: DNA-directed RNA polymerase subunit beta [Candidatus Buchananbacteria bacterium RIFCSPLOWO2_01_FULL_40_23b]
MTARSQTRRYFTPQKDSVPMPDLIEVQKNSYQWFLDHGLGELFEEVSPIRDFIGRDFELYFGRYYLDEPKFDEVTSKQKNLSYESPLRVVAKLANRKLDKVIEQEVYLGDFPIMTDRGTFIINGIERAVVSQLIRSAGIFFTSEIYGERRYYGAKLIPNRGSWLELETDINNVIWVKIDRKRKVAITALLRAFGHSNDEEILNLFKDTDTHPEISYIKNTLAKDTSHNESEGLLEVYKRIRPGDLATMDNAKSLIYAMFFNFDRYDFGKVGRYKINQRFGHDLPITKENRVLRVEDLAEVVKEIIRLNVSQKEPDDIDHLGNRRVRAIGELVQNKFRIGLARMERIIKDRMSTLDIAEITPNRLINARPVIGAVKEFFMSSQLSQFMDQTNPLAELEHKRRLSAMGPGGLSRERAGFDVRDVHPTHYGRICPIATPEGPNIGLVGHLACYARVNEYGFIETPFRRVKHDVNNKAEETENEISRQDILNPTTKEVIVKADEKITGKIAKQLGKIKEIKKIALKPRVTNEVNYLTAFQSENAITTAATTPIDENGYFLEARAEVRNYGEPGIEHVEQVDYMDVAPNQIISIATSLIPFLEHDDAVRALMGSNMQRQAVPCISPDAPIVGTGLEAKAAADSGHLIIAKTDGTISAVQSDQVQMIDNNGKPQSYRLNKFVRSNASTCINQRPIVEKGQVVKAGDVLADGPATDHGELALGQNIMVAFMAWEGYNYEDAVIVSEKMVRDDRFTSIYIEDFQVEVRDTKLGPEIVTADIPNISEEKLKDLDAEGVVRLGASVSSGDILVGKITPKGETELSAEEKLLRAIFGEKARDVRDSSLYLEHGEKGKVVDIKIFSRENGDKLSSGVIKMYQISIASLRKIQVGDKMAGRHGNKGVVSIVLPVEDMPFLAGGTPVDVILSPLGVVSRMNLGQILETHLGLAADKLGYQLASPALNGVNEEEIKNQLKQAGFSPDGKMIVYDGRSGEAFEERVTVGKIYMLKLNHMVEDKIHQRSIGPYSLITQQPLGGKAQFGGQRFGEMEVWALEAYGAAHILQEILTIKSDDVSGRSKAYESIIKGEVIKKLNIPESFNVLLRELNGLGLNIDLLSKDYLSSLASSAKASAKEEKKSEKKVAKEKVTKASKNN